MVEPMIPLPRPIYQQIAMQLYIFGASGGVAEEHAYRLTMAMVPFGCGHDGLSGFWFISQDDISSSTAPAAAGAPKTRQEIFSGCVGFLDA